MEWKVRLENYIKNISIDCYLNGDKEKLVRGQEFIKKSEIVTKSLHSNKRLWEEIFVCLHYFRMVDCEFSGELYVIEFLTVFKILR